jgi:hypothetical protein
MAQKKLASNLVFDLTLSPKKELGPTLQGKLWQKLLGSAFRSGLGKLELDHVVTGGGESHIRYDTKGMAITAYEDGTFTLHDSKFSVPRTSDLERILTAFFEVVNATTKRRVNFDADARLHMILSDRSLKKFLDDNVQFSATSKFERVFGHSKGLKSFLLQISDDVGMVVFHPNHLDFLYHAKVASDPRRKPFVSAFVVGSMKYLDSMGRYAQ